MNKLTFVIALGLSCGSTITGAQSWQPPSPTARCPSKWGATDERGSGNHMTPANVLRAAHLIKTGEAFELSHVLGRDMPLVPGRQYDVHTKRTTGPFGTNQRYSNEELVISEIGQVGTQFDGFTPSSDRPSALQLRENGRGCDAHGLQQDGDGEGRHSDDARRAH